MFTAVRRSLMALSGQFSCGRVCPLMTQNGHRPASHGAVTKQTSPLSEHSVEPLRCLVQSQGADMRRREFVVLLGGAATAWPHNSRQLFHAGPLPANTR